MKYLDIYVVIAPAPGGDYQVSAKSDAGGEGNSSLKVPFTLSALSGVMFGASSAKRGMSAGGEPTERLQTAETLGVELFEALFNGDTREVLSRTEDVAKRISDKTGVRIRLSMNLAAVGMAEVACLPWELMRRRNQKPLVVSVNTPVVRAFDTAIPIYLHPIAGKLKILLLVSNPTGTTPLNLGDEKGRVCAIWDSLENVEYVECRPVAEDILDALSQDEFHVVHYMGHGDFEAGLGGQLIMENADGSEQPISGDTFAAWLQDEPLRLVFLNACNTGTTGQQSGLHPFAGVASSLIASGVPAVVAMQFPITDEAAINFAQTFYKRVAQGLPVEQAVSEGRKSLLDLQGSEWATPVLYMRAADGDLFDRTEVKAAARGIDPGNISELEDGEPGPQHEAAAPLPFLSQEPALRPFYKQPLVLGGAAAAALAVAAIVHFAGGSTADFSAVVTDAATDTAATDDAATTIAAARPAYQISVSPDPNTAASKAIAAIDPALWVNDPGCKIAETVLDGLNLEDFEKLAKADYREAAYVLGCFNHRDQPKYLLSKSDAASTYWFEKAAKGGVPQAMYFMGELKSSGAAKDGDFNAVVRDEKLSQSWFKAAAGAGNDAAADKLANSNQANLQTN